jgi:hypothetical protein
LRFPGPAAIHEELLLASEYRHHYYRPYHSENSLGMFIIISRMCLTANHLKTLTLRPLSLNLLMRQ